jgi:hypothetical protein
MLNLNLAWSGPHIATAVHMSAATGHVTYREDPLPWVRRNPPLPPSSQLAAPRPCLVLVVVVPASKFGERHHSLAAKGGRQN